MSVPRGWHRQWTPLVLGPYHDTLALVFLSAGICRRLPWDCCSQPFSGQMLSRVEETNEPTMLSQSSPTELEHSHSQRTVGCLLATEIPAAGVGCRAMSMLPSPPHPRSGSPAKPDPGCSKDLWPLWTSAGS